MFNYVDNKAVYVIPPYDNSLYSICWLLALNIDTAKDDVVSVDIGLRTLSNFIKGNELIPYEEYNTTLTFTGSEEAIIVHSISVFVQVILFPIPI